MTIGEAIRAAAERLAATSDTARLDAELLMAEALRVSRSDLFLRRMGDPVPPGFAALVARAARARGGNRTDPRATSAGDLALGGQAAPGSATRPRSRVGGGLP